MMPLFCYYGFSRIQAANVRGDSMKKQIPLIVVTVAVLVVVIVWFVFERVLRPQCDSIFEQTTTKLSGKLDFIKTNGELVIGGEKVQELAESSQKIALHLKTCCIAQQGGSMNAEQFQGCINGAKGYETKISQVTNIINEAQAAKEQGNPQLIEQKAAEAKEAAGAATKFVEGLVKPPPPISPGPTGPSSAQGGVEQEPNNTILEPNAAEFGNTMFGDIVTANDGDYFRFHNTANLRDVIKVMLQNLSATMAPDIRVYNQSKSEIARKYETTNGADLELLFTAEPDNDYYVAVAAFGGVPSNSKYRLSGVPQKAYDAYEPNDNAATATAIKLGQTVSANILDGKDLDWYRLGNVAQKEIAVRLENMSATLLPDIRVYNQSKSEIARKYETTPGANLDFSFAAESGKEFYITVAAFGGSPSRSDYILSTQ
jgi:hypothetical protein